MLLKIVAVLVVGIVGGILHQVLFEKRLYMPKLKRDSNGDVYFEMGFLADVLMGIIAASVVALPIIEFVPVLNLVSTVFLPAVAGKPFLQALVNQYLEKSKQGMLDDVVDLKEELNDLEDSLIDPDQKQTKTK